MVVVVTSNVGIFSDCNITFALLLNGRNYELESLNLERSSTEPKPNPRSAVDILT